MKRTIKCKTLIAVCLSLLSLQIAGQVRVACVGNSITYGTGIENREADSYPAQLQKMLGEGYEVGNFGRPGATLLNHGHRPYTQQPEYRAALDFAGDIVVIHLGINDTDPRNWPNYRDEFITDYCALIDSLRGRNPKARIIIARLSPISNRHSRFQSGTRDWHDEIQRVIPLVAKARGTELIDFHTPLYNRPDLFPDGLHPNKAGAAIMAKAVFQFITGNYGGLQMPSVFTDGMVLQRDMPLNIHGIANAGDEVTVDIDKVKGGKGKSSKGEKGKAVAGKDGRWEVELKPLMAGGPYSLSVSTKKEKLTYNDVMVGEVWLCSGQSNMEFKLRGASPVPSKGGENHHAASSPFTPPLEGAGKAVPLRLYNFTRICPMSDIEFDSLTLSHINELEYLKPTKWQDCTSETAANFSAVAYYFGRMLQDSLQVPVGLICNAVGGSNIESWIDRRTLEFEFPNILSDWLHNDFIMEWCRTRAAKNIGLALKAGNNLQRHPYQPCYMYEAGIEPLDGFPIRGVIWYQGESNAHNKDAHAKLFPLLVDSWRRNWKQPEMPFLFVQLSSLNRPSWPWFRDSQRLLSQQIPHTGMAVSSDMGDSLDVHPRCKQPVGERLARLALTDVYKLPYFEKHPSAKQGPVIIDNSKFIIHNSKLTLPFDCADGLTTSDGKAPCTFELADEFGIFHPAQAEVKGSNVVVSSKDVKCPTAVRYGWQPFTRANLVNAYGLPASTFLIPIKQ